MMLLPICEWQFSANENKAVLMMNGRPLLYIEGAEFMMVFSQLTHRVALAMAEQAQIARHDGEMAVAEAQRLLREGNDKRRNGEYAC